MVVHSYRYGDNPAGSGIRNIAGSFRRGLLDWYRDTSHHDGGGGGQPIGCVRPGPPVCPPIFPPKRQARPIVLGHKACRKTPHLAKCKCRFEAVCHSKLPESSSCPPASTSQNGRINKTKSAVSLVKCIKVFFAGIRWSSMIKGADKVASDRGKPWYWEVWVRGGGQS